MARRFVALLVSTLLAIPAFPQDANFSTTVKLVVVDCIVTDKNGRPIETLTKEDFQIFKMASRSRFGLPNYRGSILSRFLPRVLLPATRRCHRAPSRSQLTPPAP